MISLRGCIQRNRHTFDVPDERRTFLQHHLKGLSPSLEHRVDEVLEGKVKDFFTNPFIIDLIGKGIYPGIEDVQPFDPSYFCFVHLTKYFPHDGVIRPSGEVSLVPRWTVHFCVNGAVTSHEAGNWEESPIAVIIPAAGVKGTIDTFIPHDVRFVGPVTLPPNARVIVKDTVSIPEESGVHVVRRSFCSGEELRRIVAETIFEMGFLPVPIGVYDWCSEPYKTVTSTGERVCHQLGPYFNGGYFPDEAARITKIAELFGAQDVSLHDIRDWSCKLENNLAEKIRPFYSFNRMKSAQKKDKSLVTHTFSKQYIEQLLDSIPLVHRVYFEKQLPVYVQRLKDCSS